MAAGRSLPRGQSAHQVVAASSKSAARSLPWRRARNSSARGAQIPERSTAITRRSTAMPERSVANRSFLMPRVGPIVGQLSDVAQRFMTLVSSDRGRSTHQPVPASIKGSGISRGALTMSPRTEEQLRRRANNARRRYTSKRLSSLKQRFPLIPPDVLERATLRQVSVAVRRIGDGQGTLSAFNPAECSSGSVSKILPLDSD